MTDTHGGPDWLGDCPPLPSSLGSPAERRNQHTPNTHTPPPCGSAPDFPTVPSLPVSSNLPRRATSVSPIVFGNREAELPAPPGPQTLLSWGTTRKSAAPNSEFLGRDGQGRPRWEGAEHPEEPPPPSPEGPYCACVHGSTHAYTVRHRPTSLMLFISSGRALVQWEIEVATTNAWGEKNHQMRLRRPQDALVGCMDLGVWRLRIVSR